MCKLNIAKVPKITIRIWGENMECAKKSESQPNLIAVTCT